MKPSKEKNRKIHSSQDEEDEGNIASSFVESAGSDSELYQQVQICQVSGYKVENIRSKMAGKNLIRSNVRHK